MRKDELQRIGDRLVVGPTTDIEPKSSAKAPVISNRAMTNIVVRLLEGKRVRRAVPGWGRLHIDRQLPFLIVYRRPAGRKDPGTARLVMGEASYLTATGNRKLHSSLASLVKAISTNIGGLFGAFLVIEIWAGSDKIIEGNHQDFRPGFRIFTSKADAVTSTVRTLEKRLRRITTKRQFAEVEVVPTSSIHPPGLSPLLSKKESVDLNIQHLGIEVKPVYRNAHGEEFPLIRRALHRGLARAVKEGVFAFTRSETTHRPSNYQSLGPRSFIKAVWQVDQQLAEVSNQFDFLLSITPTNADAAWSAFQRSRFEVIPEFTYRPLPVEPRQLKRTLFKIPIERVSDPVLAQLFRSQQNELDRKLTMLDERGTDIFFYGSLMSYGKIDDGLSTAAEAILSKFPPRSRDSSKGGYLDADEFASRASMQIEQYRQEYRDLASKVSVRDDTAGLMVSRGNLLVGKSLRTPSSRVDALIAHEVGTHVVTYFNGKAQPFRQLYVGLPNYDELQEGLAVLAEYFVGGLSKPRMRLLAARVIGAKALIDGGTFVDVFRLLNRDYEFARRSAFGITMRLFRSGGYTKDAVYLRGLIRILDYLKNGGDIEPLYVGKFGMEHLPIIKELRSREVLKAPVIRPHYLDTPETRSRLQRLRGGISVLDLVEKRR
jgi:uncharacterized protein (TIGR02421 family)